MRFIPNDESSWRVTAPGMVSQKAGQPHELWLTSEDACHAGEKAGDPQLGVRGVKRGVACGTVCKSDQID